MSLLTRLWRPDPEALQRAGRVRALLYVLRAGHTTALRRRAALALGATGAMRAVPRLLKTLAEPALRDASATALARLGATAAADPISRFLPDPDAAPWAVPALEALGWEPPPSALGAWLRIRQRRWEALIGMGPPAIGPLLARLAEPSATQAAEALRALGWEPTQDGLGVRACLLLGDLEGAAALGPLAVAPLLSAEADDDALLAALVSVGSEALEPLVAALDDPLHPRRVLAVRALGALRLPSAVHALTPLLAGSDPAEVSAACQALGQIGSASAINPLYRALQGEAPRDAARALAQIGGTKAINLLIGALHRATPPVTVAAIRALGEAGDPRATRPLLPFLGHRLSLVRLHTTLALGRLGTRTAVDELSLRLLDDTSGDVREAAASALGQIGDPRALRVLIAA
ncbi:MAG: HEAT repeat domain-containing protein, partial [Deltaproteobacteria bacterium]|nr:HEAT repeat domain-containing protein [Deltaproteobacteria bacterium]